MKKALGRRAAYQMRRVTRATAGLGAALAAALLVAASQGSLARPRALDVPLVAAVAAVLVAAIVARLRFVAPSARAQRASRLARWADPILDVQVALALVAGAYALVALTGGQASPATPLIYFLI